MPGIQIQYRVNLVVADLGGNSIGFKKFGDFLGAYLKGIFGCPIALKMYLWYTDLILSALGTYLGDLLATEGYLSYLLPTS